MLSGVAHGEALENQMHSHPVPYLALHGEDPVAWQEWGDEAVALARQQNKILYLSIGYFSCHWCHVMQKETFQNNEVAEFLNRHFIPVKVDRELEPALDRRLMNFTQRIIGRGGWPLNVFVTPDGFPIYSVLYAPASQFLGVLVRLNEVWTQSPERVLELVKNDVVEALPGASPNLDRTSFTAITAAARSGVMNHADSKYGGFGNGQKFPSAPQLEYLLNHYAANPDATVREFLELTLSAMANQGLYDHLAGGFFRYTTDPRWQIPHFEKMLYDNANLARVYLLAGDILVRPEFTVIARQTLDFMLQRMRRESGGFISSFSAVDDEDIEGGSYLWTREQVIETLQPSAAAMVLELWNLDRDAELLAGNHPRFAMSLGHYAEIHDMDNDVVRERFTEARSRLLQARDKRGLPEDDKLVAGWNGLVLTLLVDAAGAFPGSGYDKAALELRNFLVQNMWDGEQLHRSITRGERMGSASLEDYAYIASALVRFAEYSGQDRDRELALQIARTGWQKFYINNGWLLGDGTRLAPVAGEIMIPDSATASPSAVLVLTSLGLARQYGDIAMEIQALSALNRGKNSLVTAPFWYVSQLEAIELALNP